LRLIEIEPLRGLMPLPSVTGMPVMTKHYQVEQRERAVKMVLDHLDECRSVYAACRVIGPKVGVGAESLRRWTLQAQVDANQRPGATSAEQQRIKDLEREVRDPKEANDILKAASVNSTRQRNTIDHFIGGVRGEDWPAGLPSQKRQQVWEMWKAGRSISEISRTVGSPPGSIFSILLPYGGIYQPPQRRRAGCLSLAEREEISRGLAAGLSYRVIGSLQPRLNRRHTSSRLQFTIAVATPRAFPSAAT
jgi:transposase